MLVLVALSCGGGDGKEDGCNLVIEIYIGRRFFLLFENRSSVMLRWGYLLAWGAVTRYNALNLLKRKACGFVE